MVLIQNHVKGPFNPKYIGDYRVISLKGNQVEIQPALGGPTEMKHIKHVKHVVWGPTEMKHIKHVKHILPADKYIDQLPDYSGFGRNTTLRINPSQIPDLHWKLANTYHTTNIGQSELGGTTVSVHDITVKTVGYVTDDNCMKGYKTSLNTRICTTQSRHESAVCSVIPIT